MRVAVVDSGVAAGHPHVGAVTEAIAIGGDGPSDDVADRLGHGTAIAAAIREKAPDVELLSVRIFHRTLATDNDALSAGIAQAVALGARLINLSLGTANPAHEGRLHDAVAAATQAGALVVSAFESNGVRWIPGSFNDVIGVVADWEEEREAMTITASPSGSSLGVLVRASAYPRPIPGVPREKNLSGVSFAVANATGFLARLFEGRSAETPLDLVRSLMVHG